MKKQLFKSGGQCVNKGNFYRKTFGNREFFDKQNIIYRGTFMEKVFNLGKFQEIARIENHTSLIYETNKIKPQWVSI